LELQDEKTEQEYERREREHVKGTQKWKKEINFLSSLADNVTVVVATAVVATSPNSTEQTR
jgi:hypothetical protein